jgi:acetolactate synthase-1/2/3 large subunit
VALAAAYRIPGKVIDDRKDLPSALNEMLNNKGSFLLEVMVTKENNVFPMVPQGCSVSEIRLK